MLSTHVSLTGVSKSFGGQQALSGVDLTILSGTVHCLIGENGAGKSTLGKILAGTHRPDAGRMVVDGDEVVFRSPADALSRGVAGMAQEVALVPALSVADNILLGIEKRKHGFVIDSERASTIRSLADSFGFDVDPRALVRDLTIATQQKVEILKALARGSRMIVMDEPTASLGATDAQSLLDIVRDLRARGTTIVYISHHLDEVTSIADAVTVLRDGAVVYDGAPLPKGDLITHMLGRSLESSFPAKRMVGADVDLVLETIELSSGSAFRDISLSVRRGEIVGLAGLVGAGRTDIARAIAGVDKPTHGQVMLHGTEVRFASPSAAMAAGVHLIPEDRKTQGLILARPVRENISYSILRSLARLGFVRKRSEKSAAAEAADATNIRSAGLEVAVSTLSGGNQQKVMFARGSLAQPHVLLVDEPTKGVDIGAKFAIHELVVKLAEQGVAVLVISSEHEELMGLAHRIVAIHEGTVVAEFAGPDFVADDVTRSVFGAVLEERETTK